MLSVAESRIPFLKKEQRGVFIRHLTVQNFRNYKYLSLPIHSDHVVLTGPNGIGKTNLMEAVSMLAPGKGLRQSKLIDMLKDHQIDKSWTVSAVFDDAGDEIEVGTAYKPDATKKVEKRQIHINKTAIKSQDELGEICSIVWLVPSMDRLFSADPAGRRRFFDRLVQSFNPRHAGNCMAYSNALRQWNSLIKEHKFDEKWLSALEKTLGKYGELIHSARQNYLIKLQRKLSLNRPEFPTALLSFSGKFNAEQKTGEELADLITYHFKRSRQFVADNISISGIHNIDLQAIHSVKNRQASMCSTGEQKALVISILLAHIETLSELHSKLPLILFDELGAHLDIHKTEALLELLNEFKTQIWLTGTSTTTFSAWKNNAQILQLDNFQNKATLEVAS